MQDLERDRELARRAADGDEIAWKEIYDATSDRLFSLLCYQVGDRDEALDLLQESYLKAYQRLDGYRGDAPLGAWIRKIALRKALDWKRSVLQRIKKNVALVETTASVEPRVENVRFESENTALQDALLTLSKNQRAVLLLHDWEEWSFKEISQVLKCKESTVRVHHVRAKEKMRQALSSLTPSCEETEGLEGQKA